MYIRAYIRAQTRDQLCHARMYPTQQLDQWSTQPHTIWGEGDQLCSLCFLFIGLFRRPALPEKGQTHRHAHWHNQYNMVLLCVWTYLHVYRPKLNQHSTYVHAYVCMYVHTVQLARLRGINWSISQSGQYTSPHTHVRMCVQYVGGCLYNTITKKTCWRSSPLLVEHNLVVATYVRTYVHM